jgi:hypothetical protein
MMEVCTSGFAEHRRGYFISSGDASGVMTGRRALLRIPNGGSFPLDVKGFSTKQCSWFPNEDSLPILRQGARVCAYSARGKVPEYVQNNGDAYAQIKKVITEQVQKINCYFIAENP